jgi:predicted dehydrogenase
MSRRSSRRQFLQTTAALGASAAMFPHPAIGRWTRGNSPNARVRFASIGVGGKGESDTNDAAAHGDLVAICDIDESHLGKMADAHPNAKKYFDYRKMLEELAEAIDAVTVSTPDHTHAPASVMAMRMGKHCFCQKPLTWSVEEARVMRQLAAEKKLATQMGNQGTAENGFREGVEIIRSGALGPVKEIQIWTNRPVWPCGLPRPTETPEVPSTVHWSEFLGAAKPRPYHPAYHPFAWRGWLDFGTGALGDMACHTLNVAAMALELFDPQSVEVVESSGIVDNESFPSWTVIKTQFGPRGDRGPLTMTWYDGGEKLPQDKKKYLDYLKEYKYEPPPPEDPDEKPGPPESGLMVIGEKGAFFSVNDYGAERLLLPKERFADYKKPEPVLPRSPGHFQEWVDAIGGGPPAYSNFDYAGRLTETVLLGTVAIKAGTKIEWDAENMRAIGNSAADPFIRREYRKGWSIHV